MSFTWLWIVQEISPVKNRLGKSAFVLYYASSSGYFTRARYEEPAVSAFLAGYEELMRGGDVLHTGTHPPGLFLAFHGLIAACESSPILCQFLDATQPLSFREALEVIAANSLRRSVPRPLLPLDRRVLWLATLLVMLSAALAVIPLYGLVRRTCSVRTAWVGAAIWTAVPAVAIFIPKSDVLFPLIGLTLLWLWLTAWDNQSLIAALSAGFVAWVGLFCSLAFLPVFLAAALMTLGSGWQFSSHLKQNPASPCSRFSFSTRQGFCLIAALFGFLLPVYILWQSSQLNLFNVWWLNYRNHAGFYDQYHRTYWKWLLVNPVEFLFAAGCPVALMGAAAAWSVCCGSQSDVPSRTSRAKVIACSMIVVGGLLWLTGKNSGEAARLWILFLPWLVWLACLRLDAAATENALNKNSSRGTERQMIVLVALQFLLCLLTVTRISGFHSESGSSG